MDKRTICLLNDSFPPEIDGVANAVVNYAKNITKSGENAIVVTPTMPGADDSAFPFPVLRYPSIDTRKKLGYVAGYPFSPETARVLTALAAQPLRGSENMEAARLVESLCAQVASHLRSEGLSQDPGDWLWAHGPQLMRHVQEPELRRMDMLQG